MNKESRWTKQLTDSSNIGILVVDAKRNNLFVNNRLCELFGYSKEILLQTNAEIFHVNHTTFLTFAELAFNAVLKGTPLSIDYQFKRHDGTLFWIHISGDPIPSNKEVLWTMVDITKRVQAQEEATYQFNMLNTVINTTPDIIFYKDYLHHDGKYIGCNNAFSSFVGISKEQIVMHNDIEIFGEDVGNFFRTKDKEMLQNNKTTINEEWVTYPNGHNVLMHTSKTPFYDNNKKVLGVLGISRDITHQHKSNENIKNLNERMELALLGNNDGIWDWNLLTNDVYYSSRWKEIIGYRGNELPNEFSVWEDRVHPDDKPQVLKEIQEHIDGKSKFVNNIHRMKHKNDHWVWINNRAKAIFDDNGKATRIIGTHTDITQEKILQLKYAQQAQVHDSVISTDLNGLITGFNHGSEVLLEYQANEVIGQHVSILYLKEDLISLGNNIELLMKNSGHNSEVRLVKKSGVVLDAELSLSLLKDEKHHPIGMIGYAQNITKRKAAEKGLKEQHKYLQTIIDGVDDPIMVIKENYTIELMNSTLRKSLKYSNIADPQNPKCYEVSHHRTSPCDGIDHPCPLRTVLETKEHMTVVHNHPTLQGEARYIELSATPLYDKKYDCIGIIEAARDITTHLEVQDRLRQQQDILNHQAHHDALTGLPNRVLFNDRLEQAIEQAKRNNKKVALLFIDLDHFKEINDSLGHDVGDDVLKVVTSRLNETIREKDTVSRLGGDEFTVILEDLEQAQDSSLISDKILTTLSKAITINSHQLYVSSSIGISIYPDDGESAQNLLKFADSAMYKAKDEGRNNYQYYNAMMTELAFERVVMEASLREALVKEEFVVYYQPQVDGKTGTIMGTEALVRWQHPTMGLVAPAKFIPLAEATGLIVELDRFVMKTAMTQIAKWYKKGLNPGVLAMNLAVKQLQQKDFIAMFTQLIRQSECEAEWLELEVTEGQIMNNPEEAIKILQRISELGVELAIDDFGTGYSSLAYLKKLPIDKLKIDQAFVRDLPHGDEDSAITKAVIALAKSLNLKIIAEGVETKEQKDFIIDNGCDNIQGYFYYQPVPAEDLEKILLEKR
jgi:diguanylate cyclase (GGDEF)-like protein/PAS domain S-box-containing protein